ncbi:MAG: hypothetical protein PHE83_04710 [Opitutaceae bacterium]|nr:hypothetical protein [Opitutaceae bacterium]
MSVLVAWPWVQRWRGLGHCHQADIPVRAVRRGFPWWGSLAVAWTIVWWWLAWTRQPWLAWAQRYTFTPLWLGFIVTASALAWGRGAACLMLHAPGKWLPLFAVSAAFWWVFEWLNRFVANWHYLGVEQVGPCEYVVHSSVCFSTVLPAVAAVREWLGTWPRLQAVLAAGPRWSWVRRRGAVAAMIGAGMAGLVLTGAHPRYFYPALWVAPLLIGVGLSALRPTGGWWRGISSGDWRNAGSWALAALVCGFFWECWNLHSLAKWVYSVPFVQRWQVFEMPLLGYTGYLPFGLVCGLAVAWVVESKEAGGEAGGADPPKR